MGHELKDQEVAAKYDAAFPKDRRVTLQGIYAGPLSSINIEGADKLMAQKSNLLLLKQAKPAAVANAKPEEVKK